MPTHKGKKNYIITIFKASLPWMLITILAAILTPSGRQVFDRRLSVTWESSTTWSQATADVVGSSHCLLRKFLTSSRDVENYSFLPIKIHRFWWILQWGKLRPQHSKWGIDTINVQKDFSLLAWVSVSITTDNQRIVHYTLSPLF